MKKYFIAAMALFIAVAGVMAKPDNADKKLWKSATKRAKTLKKEGWRSNGSKELDVLLYEHYVKLKDEKNQELMVSIEGQTNVKTFNQAQRWAVVSAATLYAQQARSAIMGRVTQEIAGGLEGSAGADDFYAAYEAAVAKEINGELKPSVSIVREKKGGGFDYRIYYLVNEDEASNARLRAMQNAQKESDFARQNAEKISDFVREGFQIEE